MSSGVTVSESTRRERTFYLSPKMSAVRGEDWNPCTYAYKTAVTS